MAGGMYDLGGRGKSRIGMTTQEVIKIPSPVTGEDIEFKMMKIASADIKQKTFKCRYNGRSYMHLGKAAVLDILPEIRQDKRNLQPAKGVMNNGKVEVLEGMRRLTAVSLVEDAAFYILVAKNLSEEEKRRFATTSDKYEKPCAIDIGFSMLEAKEHSEKKLTHEDLASMFEVSTGAVSEAISFASLPSELYVLFPSLNLISYGFLRKANKHHKKAPQQFREAVSKAVESGLRVAVNDGDTIDELKTRCKDLESEFMAMLEPSAKKPPVTRWSRINAPKGVKAKVKRNGSVQIDIDESKMDDKLAEKLFKLLNHN